MCATDMKTRCSCSGLLGGHRLPHVDAMRESSIVPERDAAYQHNRGDKRGFV